MEMADERHKVSAERGNSRFAVVYYTPQRAEPASARFMDVHQFPRWMMKWRCSLVLLTTMVGFLSAQGLANVLFQKPTVRAGLQVGLMDEVQEFFPDTKLDNPVKEISMHVARNTVAGVHVMITGLKTKEVVRFSVFSIAGRSTAGAQWYRLIDVPVAENTGLDRNTEKYSGMINPYVIRRAPFRVYDPLRPVLSPVDADSTSLALRLELPIDSTVTPGKYVHRIRVEVGSVVFVRNVTVIVHRAMVPPLAQSTVAYINWLNPDNICSAHEVEKWSEPFWAMLGKYARTMARGRQNAFWFLWNEFFTFDSAGNVAEFRRDRLERYIGIFLQEGFKIIHGAPMVGRRFWGSSDMLLSVKAADGKDVDATSEKGKRMLSQMAQRVIGMMKDHHWDGIWLQGVFDEPEDEFVDRYRELISLLRGLCPDIKILEATMTMKVSGIVNVWCPQVQEYQANREFFDKRKEVGDRVWVYTCLAPGGPWLNRLLDEERVRQVYMGWALAKYNLQGFLHWGGNFHTSKPFEELVRFHMEGQYLPAGDSHILYPVHEGPLSSHRFEAHRIGMEDYELLAQLKAHDAGRMEQIIGTVLQGFDKYSKEISAYRTAKKLLLDAVDEHMNAEGKR
jgi:hypothetical protein